MESLLRAVGALLTTTPVTTMSERPGVCPGSFPIFPSLAGVWLCLLVLFPATFSSTLDPSPLQQCGIPEMALAVPEASEWPTGRARQGIFPTAARPTICNPRSEA